MYPQSHLLSSVCSGSFPPSTGNAHCRLAADSPRRGERKGLVNTATCMHPDVLQSLCGNQRWEKVWAGTPMICKGFMVRLQEQVFAHQDVRYQTSWRWVVRTHRVCPLFMGWRCGHVRKGEEWVQITEAGHNTTTSSSNTVEGGEEDS